MTPNRLTTLPPLSALLALVLPLAGCGGGGTNGGSGGAGGTTTSSAPAPAPVLSTSTVTAAGLTATLAEDRATVLAGGSVTYTLTLTNTTAQAATFQLFSGCAFNVLGGTGASAFTGMLTVLGPAGHPVTPPPPCGVIGTGPATTLAPGQSVSGTVTYGDIFPTPGRYTALGQIEIAASPQDQFTNVGPLTVTVQ